MKKGFTVIEVLLVVAITAIMAGIVILAINPNNQVSDANEARQSADAVTILDAVYQYAIDNNANFPDTISTTKGEICATGVDVSTCMANNLVDLSALTNNQEYLLTIPVDPEATTLNGAGYTINLTSNNGLVVKSSDGVVSVTR